MGEAYIIFQACLNLCTIDSETSKMGEQRSVVGVVKKFVDDYFAATPTKLKLIDAYMGYILITGVIQFVYCCLVGTFPFNSFLSGFISCVGSFILAACLRIQSNPQNKADFCNIGPERAFADFLFASIVLHLVVVDFIEGEEPSWNARRPRVEISFHRCQNNI